MLLENNHFDAQANHVLEVQETFSPSDTELFHDPRQGVESAPLGNPSDDTLADGRTNLEMVDTEFLSQTVNEDGEATTDLAKAEPGEFHRDDGETYYGRDSEQPEEVDRCDSLLDFTDVDHCLANPEELGNQSEIGVLNSLSSESTIAETGEPASSPSQANYAECDNTEMETDKPSPERDDAAEDTSEPKPVVSSCSAPCDDVPVDRCSCSFQDLPPAQRNVQSERVRRPIPSTDGRFHTGNHPTKQHQNSRQRGASKGSSRGRGSARPQGSSRASRSFNASRQAGPCGPINNVANFPAGFPFNGQQIHLPAACVPGATNFTSNATRQGNTLNQSSNSYGGIGTIGNIQCSGGSTPKINISNFNGGRKNDGDS